LIDSHTCSANRSPLSEVDALESPDAVAAELATSLPRAEDISALVLLEPEALSDAGRVDLLVAFERSIALLQAAQQQVLASLDGRALDWSGTKLIDYPREQVGATLRLSPGTAERRLSIARTLIERLPATLELLRGGQLTYLHAMKLAEAVTPFDAETTRKIEQRMLTRAPEQTLSQFGTSLRRAVIAADPRRAEQRHQDAIPQRRGGVHPARRRHHRTVGAVARRRRRAHRDRAQLPRQRPDR
jgi:hypothetical protein